MACFASEAELETILGRLHPDYGHYASKVWQNSVRTAHQLANADKEDLVAAGVTSAIHAIDIKARAQQATDSNSFITMYALRPYKAYGLYIACRVSARSRVASPVLMRHDSSGCNTCQ